MKVQHHYKPNGIAISWIKGKIEEAKIHGVISEIVELTPDLARSLLAHNPHNRPLSHQRIDQYARDMRNGAWPFNGEPIIVSVDGTLNDGQHRCEAVIAANVAVKVLIVFGGIPGKPYDDRPGLHADHRALPPDGRVSGL